MMMRLRGLVLPLFDWLSALLSHGFGLHCFVLVDEALFEGLESFGFLLGKVGFLGRIREDVEKLETNEFSVLDFVEMRFFPA